MRHCLRGLLLSSFIATCIFSAGAQTPDADLQGYFLIQSALATDANGDGYVEVKGPFTVAPDINYDTAITHAGSVMRLRAVKGKLDGKEVYKIGNLSSQGIEVFGTPQEDYLNGLLQLTQDINVSDFYSAAYRIQREGAKVGYIATVRMLIEAIFTVVATRLDDEVPGIPAEWKTQHGYDMTTQESLADFALRFNKEVSENIDLHAYLEPTAQDGQYRLFFHWIDCTEVSKFYLANDKNKKSFELGFEAMRRYMAGKAGLDTGERIDANEAATWKEWGLDISEKYANKYKTDEDGLPYYDLKYEDIFADHELCYNWVKMHVIRLMDPATTPNVDMLGINFGALASELQRHAIFQSFLQYAPSLQEGQKLYLANGRFLDDKGKVSTFGTVSNNERRFGLLDASVADNVQATVWHLRPLSTDKQTSEHKFRVAPESKVTPHVNPTASVNKNTILAAAYYDFPVRRPADATQPKLYEVAQQTDLLLGDGYTVLADDGQAHYVVYATETDKVDRCTPFLAEAEGQDAKALAVDIVWEAQASDYNPSFEVAGFTISDETVAKQYAPRAAVQSSTDGTATAYGVLLSSPADADELYNRYGLDVNLTSSSVYVLAPLSGYTADTSSQQMVTPWFQETETIPSNHAFLVATDQPSPIFAPIKAIALGEPNEQTDTRVPTAIDTIDAESAADATVIYDIYGRRVSHMAPGALYLVNGKKFVNQ